VTRDSLRREETRDKSSSLLEMDQQIESRKDNAEAQSSQGNAKKTAVQTHQSYLRLMIRTVSGV
jgi:hypothetical protein